MTRFEFSLAQAQDDAALRQRMADERMEGHISVSFRREPSYFAGSAVQGQQAQVIKCVDGSNGELVALGARLTLSAFINGQPQRLGYLSDLRGKRALRGGTLLARGYRYLRALHEQDPVPLYFSLILEGNQAALANLTGARVGLPQYQDYGRVLTPALHLDLPRRAIKLPGIRFTQARVEQLPAVFEFIQRQYAGKQFAPVYVAADMHGPRLLGLRAQDLTLALRGNRLVGVLAAWDQRAFRQTHIERYSTTLARLRPFYNVLARLTPLKPLPAIGAPIPYLYLALTAVEDNDPNLYRALLAQVHAQRRRGPWHYVIAGLHERDPLVAVLAEYRRIEAAGRLFVIHYPEHQSHYQALDGRPAYIEIAAV